MMKTKCPGGLLETKTRLNRTVEWDLGLQTVLELVVGTGDFSRFESVCASLSHRRENMGVGETTGERIVPTPDRLGLQDESGLFSTWNVATL